MTAEGLAESALSNVALLEKYDFEDIVISLKSSNVQMNYEAYRIVHEACGYPLHIGVTEAGTPARGKVKSAAGIGALLLDGIGDTMRVSLTADPVEEVLFARQLLAALDIRREGVEIVSCPTCGRTQVDLEKIATDEERRPLPRNAGGQTRRHLHRGRDGLRRQRTGRGLGSGFRRCLRQRRGRAFPKGRDREKGQRRGYRGRVNGD